MKRKSLLLAVVMAVALMFVPGTATIFAASDPIPPEPPGYAYVDSICVSLSISSGKATAVTTVKDADGDTTRITVKMTLQKKSGKSWHNVKSWNKSTASNSLTMSKTKSVSKGKYRTKAVIKAYKGDKSETITKYSETIKY